MNIIRKDQTVRATPFINVRKLEVLKTATHHGPDSLVLPLKGVRNSPELLD